MSCKLTNYSELATRIEPRFKSKIIGVVPNDASIILQPKQSREIRVELIPRKRNANYARAIDIYNVNNPEHTVEILVQANNMEPQSVIYHSLFIN